VRPVQTASTHASVLYAHLAAIAAERSRLEAARLLRKTTHGAHLV